MSLGDQRKWTRKPTGEIRNPARELAQLNDDEQGKALQREGWYSLKEAGRVMPVRTLTKEEIAREYGQR
jgi:hypothetical protein